MAILKSQIFGGSLIGVYLLSNNSYVLYPNLLLKPLKKKFQATFEVPFYPMSINNSNLLGIYSASNKYGIIIPSITREDEITKLESYLDGEAEIGLLNSKDNAFGNLILCNDKGAIISSFLKENKKEIEDILNVEVVIYEFANSHLPGSISVANNLGCAVHPLTNDDEIELINSVLKVKETDVSTINRGIPYLSAGAIVNDQSGIFGSASTGPEMMRLSNVLRL
ncbi:MAG: translation initiation factor IF-6 [Candidatus Lokiarchaeota archaeon]|nr:translation initiation factor IF-6 [Candidatus Lokiarchaeota archaeon]